MRRFFVTLCVLMFTSLCVWPQGKTVTGSAPEDTPLQGFQMNVIFGSDLLADPSDSSSLASWAKIGVQPSYAFDRFSCSLDLAVRFIVDANSDIPFSFYSADWVPSEDRTFLDVYLPKILYLGYGSRGKDSFFFSAGRIDDLTLGDGLIVSDYGNTDFLPKQGITGLRLGLDGSLAGFPYVGLEAMTGNLARVDVLAGRVYVRPLAFLGSSVTKDSQIGATVAIDRSPLRWLDDDSLSAYPSEEPIVFYGIDLHVPVMKSDPFTVSVSGDWALEPNGAQGIAFGLETKIVRFVNFGAQTRYFQEGFIPSYFDSVYDFYRAERFAYMMNSEPGQFVSGWASHIGFSFVKDLIAIDLAADGRFAAIPGEATDNSGCYPHLKGSVVLLDGLLDGFSLNFAYEKFFIGRDGKWAWDVSDLQEARLGFGASYKREGLNLYISWVYGWDPLEDSLNTCAGISVTIRLTDQAGLIMAK